LHSGNGERETLYQGNPFSVKQSAKRKGTHTMPGSRRNALPGFAFIKSFPQVDPVLSSNTLPKKKRTYTMLSARISTLASPANTNKN
jgi:hypothetical protein